MELINDAEKAAEKDILSLVQFTEDLRRQYGKEPNSMEILLKKLYVKRMAADLGINRIYVIGRMVGMETNMTKNVFRMIKDSMASDVLRSSLIYDDGQIKVIVAFTPAIIYAFFAEKPFLIHISYLLSTSLCFMLALHYRFFSSCPLTRLV